MMVDNDEARRAIETLKAAGRLGFARSIGEVLGRPGALAMATRPRSGVEEDPMVKARRAARRWYLGETLVVHEPGPTDHRAQYLPPNVAAAVAKREGLHVAWWYPLDEVRVVLLTHTGTVLLVTETAAGVEFQAMRRPTVDELPP